MPCRTGSVTVRIGRRALAAGLAVCAGCTHAGMHVPISSAPVIAQAIEPSRFSAGASILSGFDIASPDDSDVWRPGDRVLLGLLIRRPAPDAPGMAELVRYLDIELGDEVGNPPMVALTFRPDNAAPMRFESVTLATRIRVYDEAAVPIARSHGAFPHSLLDLGPFDAAMYDLERRESGSFTGDGRGPRTREDVRRGVMGWMSLVMFSGAMGKNPVFINLVDAVIERPSLLAMLFSPSIALKDGPAGPARLGEGWSPPGGLGDQMPACRVPLDVSLADKPVARTTMVVVPCRPPLGLCGGVVSLDGEKAEDSRVTIHVELLAARRGSAAAAVRMPADRR